MDHTVDVSPVLLNVDKRLYPLKFFGVESMDLSYLPIAACIGKACLCMRCAHTGALKSEGGDMEPGAFPG